MKRLLYAAVAAAALAIAAPALAQPYPATQPGPEAAPGHDIRGQLDDLRQRVKTGFDQGQLGQGETDRLYREIDKIAAIAQSDRTTDGRLDGHDRTALQDRIDGLSRSIHWQRAEGGPAPMPVVPAAEPMPAPAPIPTGGVWTLDQRENWLQARIDRGVDDHRLSGHEVARGQQELHAIRVEQASLIQRDGGALSPEDRTYLVGRLDQLNQTLRWEGRNPPAPWSSGM